MYSVKCLYDNEYRTEEAYSVAEFPYNLIASDHGKKYISLPATFDIETTTINKEPTPEAYMYIWQMCINGFVVFGRTWQEWQQFLNNIKEKLQLNKDKKLVIYVHNLSYEFGFCNQFLEFDNIFATDRHKVLKASNDCFEFRCSYRLSNMNLAKFIENSENTHHNKGLNDLDYRDIRTPKDELTNVEYGYCYNDVLGLYEALLSMLQTDTLETIPLTSTGFVRRDCRLAMRKNKYNRSLFLKTKLNKDLYILNKEAFRGGNTASSRFHTNEILKNIGSYDISSSYPYVMVAEQFPMGKFMYYEVETLDDLKYINNKYCTLGRYLFINLRLKDNVPIPYIPYSKSICNKAKCYNGRVLEAEACQISLTNIDFEIINNQYDYDDLLVKDTYVSRKDKLPKELIDQVFHYFNLKSTLKGDDEHYYEYVKAKNKLNSIYGMCVTDIVHREINFQNGEWLINDSDIDNEISKYYKSYNNFLMYQIGVFVTAHARKRLQQAIDVVGMDVVYCDTDSVKYIGNHDNDFKQLNEQMIKYNQEHNIKHTIEVNNKVFMLGQFDSENQKGKTYCYDEFITLGAKKYAYKINGKIGVTVSGLEKRKGAEELERGNGLKDFKNGKVFIDSGRTVAYFNNMPIHKIKVKNVEIETASNIAIVDTTYTLGITDTMLDIIDLERNKNKNE